MTKLHVKTPFILVTKSYEGDFLRKTVSGGFIYNSNKRFQEYNKMYALLEQTAMWRLEG